MSSLTDSHPETGTLARWVDGALTRNDSEALEAHLARCSACRDQARTLRLAAERLEPATRPAPLDEGRFLAETMAALDDDAPPRRRWLPLGMAAATAAIVFVLMPPSDTSRFIPRGDNVDVASKLGVEVFVHAAGAAKGRPAVAGESLPGDAGFSFVLYNRTGAPREALVFGLDAAGAVHWFYPLWLDADRPPSSQPLPASPAVIQLPDAVGPDAPAPGRFVVVAHFPARRTSVETIESTLAAGGLDALQGPTHQLALEIAP